MGHVTFRTTIKPSETLPSACYLPTQLGIWRNGKKQLIPFRTPAEAKSHADEP